MWLTTQIAKLLRKSDAEEQHIDCRMSVPSPQVTPAWQEIERDFERWRELPNNNLAATLRQAAESGIAPSIGILRLTAKQVEMLELAALTQAALLSDTSQSGGSQNA